MKTKIYFCLECREGSSSKERIKHTCSVPFTIAEATVTYNLLTWRRRFVNWFWSLDMSYLLSFMGGVILNTLLVPHLNLSVSASLLESFCVGFLLIGLLRERK